MNLGKDDKSSSSSNNFSGTGNFNQTGTDSQSGTSSATPTNPDFVSTIMRSIADGGVDLAAADPKSYIAGPNALQTRAGAVAGSLGGSPYNFDAAADLDRQAADTSYATPLMNADPLTVSGGKASQFMQNYMDPALQQEVGASEAAFDNNAAQTKAQQALDLAKSGAFGGSGAGVAQGVTNGQLALARGQLDAGLRQTAFNQALQGGESDAANATAAREANAANNLQEQQIKAALGNQVAQQQINAGNALTGTSTAFDANQRANAGSQADIGSILQQISQSQASAPLALQQYLQQLFSGLPLNLLHGETDTTNQTGAQNQSGTQTQSGTSNGTGDSSGFGFGVNLFGNGKG